MSDKFGNDHRAAHRVHTYGHGYCVKFMYEGFEISLAMDGENTQVYTGEDMLFSTPGTDVLSILRAKTFVDELQG